MKHVELILEINKLLLLHLVGFSYIILPTFMMHGQTQIKFTLNKVERKEEHYAFTEIGCYRCAIYLSWKLFEVSSICLDTFSDLCDQRT